MDKKNYVLKVLNVLKDDRKVAEWLIVLIERNKLDNDVIDAILLILQGAIKQTQDKATKEKLNESQSILRDIKEMEAIEREKNDKEILDLEKKIENL